MIARVNQSEKQTIHLSKINISKRLLSLNKTKDWSVIYCKNKEGRERVGKGRNRKFDI